MDESLVESRGDYYMDTREFPDGSVEVVLKAIRPMHDGAIRSAADPDSYSSYCKANGLPASVASRLFSLGNENDDELSSGFDPFKKEQNHSRAVRRAKQKVRWLCKVLEADRLLTCTYRENMIDRARVLEDTKRFIRLVRKGWKGQGGEPGWKYVAVIEQQERGAYHVHFAVKGWQRVSFLRAAWSKAVGGTGLETGEDTVGNIDVTSPKVARWGTSSRSWKVGKLAAYLVKYMAKTFDEESEEKKRYWHSRDLALPVRKRFMLCATDLIGAIKEMSSVVYFYFGHQLDFSRSWLGLGADSLWLSLGEPV